MAGTPTDLSPLPCKNLTLNKGFAHLIFFRCSFKRMFRKISGGATRDHDDDECYTNSSLRVSTNDAFQKVFPDEAKDAAMQLINTERMATWIATKLVPAINQIGESHNVEKAKTLSPPMICMQRKYVPPQKKISNTRHPSGDTLWFSKNFRVIEEAVKPSSTDRAIVAEDDETIPIQRRLEKK